MYPYVFSIGIHGFVDRKPRRETVRPIKASVRPIDVEKAPHQKAGAREQHEDESDFADNQAVTYAGVRKTIADALMERHRLDSRASKKDQRRRHSKSNRAPHRHAQ